MTHTNRARLSKLSLGLMVALAAAPVFAQSTSAGVSGRVTGADGQVVGGAEVTITHVESGTVSRATTDANGRYSARGLRVGGPYSITVNKAGAGSSAKNDVYLGLDQVAQVDTQLNANVSTLDTVTVVGTAEASVFGADNKGVSTNMSRKDLDRMPSPDRSIQNVVRADPRVVVTDRDRGAFSALGQNFRYNSITVDTINAGDPFGLNDNGLPTKGTPISQDAIEAYDISTANYDVATRRGVGATVNAVTKSGTNEFHGSFYYVYQDADKMIGKNLSGRKWTGFTKDTTVGATFGGPILKDKLFFFASYEKGVKESPGSVFGPEGSGATTEVRGMPQSDVDAIIAAATARGLAPGNLEGSGTDLESERGLVKLDWNINESHRASLRLSRTEEYEPIIVNGGTNTLVLSSGWYALDKVNTSYTLSFYDDWSENFSTETSVGFNKFEQLRGPLNGRFQPAVTVRNSGADTGPAVQLGTEFSSQANQLAVDTWNAYFAGNWYLGDHVVKAGIDYQSDDFYNLFLQGYNGSYTFNSLADFNSGTYRRYSLNLPAAGYTLDNVAALFKLKQYGFFVQDTWQVTDKLSLQAGLRYDLPKVDPDPTFNPCFAAAPGTLGSLGPCGLRNNPANPNAATGGYGFTNANTIDGNGVLQPRFSFNYSFDTERPTQLRGGAGLFVSNTPAVWVANPYSNNGVAVAAFDVNRRRLPTDPPFSSDGFNQNVPGTSTTPGLGSSSMTVSVVDPDFEIPTVAKYSLGIDHELPWRGTVFTAEYQYLDVVNGIHYQNLNLGASTGRLPDGRLSYARFPANAPGGANTARWNANPSFSNQVIYLTNTDKGKSHSLTFSLKKPFADNWSGMLAYSFGRSTDVNPGTSSVANSSFQNRSWVNPNDDYESTSNYEIPHRILASLTWEKNFFGDYATRVSAFYDGHTGAPYSWIFGNDVNGDSYFRDLAFIPMNRGDVEFNTASQPLINSFFTYLANNPDLQRNSGRIFERNDANAAWVNQLDLSVSQEVPGFFKGHKGELRFDIFNVLNMIDKEWGVERRADFPLERRLADVAGVNPVTGRYIYDISGVNYNRNGTYQPNALPVNESFTPSQRWSVLLTARYTF